MNKLKEEIDFRDLLKNPLRLFGWIYPVILALLVLAGIYYLNNSNEISFNQVETTIGKQIANEIPRKKGTVIPAFDLSKLKSPDLEFTEIGEELYETNCSSCHGSNGLGDGLAGTSMNPLPRNFSETSGWTNSRDFIGMYKTLEEGIIQNGMASYEYIIPEQRLAILFYISELANIPDVTEEQISELDLTYGISREITTSNTIPVKLAIDKIYEERKIVLDNLDVVKELITLSDKYALISIIKENLRDIDRMLNYLSSAPTSLSYQDFKSIILSDPGLIGFDISVIRMEESELRNIFEGLNKIKQKMQNDN